uniref:AlNc14C3G396 protein n=1 Tax=Albugo laibachii Nc14 TaxID=890382 RepID=F0VZR7_9STRA|nr:AlNc14C3G396 [Albugo laibachii Nc14]|eukprot:CCA14288.1 AlNc14C3G396 [Albugo laibachii Nc14]
MISCDLYKYEFDEYSFDFLLERFDKHIQYCCIVAFLYDEKLIQSTTLEAAAVFIDY